MATRYKKLDYLGFRFYRVGTDGSVWSLFSRQGKYTGKWRRMIPMPVNKWGHLSVTLHGERKWVILVHRLILTAFIGNCPRGKQGRHLDGNPANNKLINLRWGTPKEDRQDMIRHGRLRIPYYKGEKNHFAKLTEEQVRKIRALHAEGKSARSLASLFDVKPVTIQQVVNRETWTHI